MNGRGGYVLTNGIAPLWIGEFGNFVNQLPPPPGPTAGG
jgi:hypothetical protein